MVSFEKSPSLKVFLCHTNADKVFVRDLYKRLKAEGVEPWLDEENLLPGQSWWEEIRKAVRNSHVVIVCLSLASISKEGTVQKELKHALDIADEKPEDSIFIIPLRLEECNTPSRLQRWHWIDYFEDKDRAYSKLIKALNQRAAQLSIALIPLYQQLEKLETQMIMAEERRDWSGVIELGQQILELDETYPIYRKLAEAYNQRGTDYTNKGEYKLALVDYNRTLELNPNFALAYNGRGYNYIYMRQYERAIRDLSRAIELEPSYVYAYNNRGWAYNEIGDYEKALSDLNKALELSPNYAWAYTNRGNTYYLSGKYERALQDLNRALDLSPGLAVAYNSRGSTYIKLGQYERAIQDLSRCIEFNPNYFLAYKNRGIAYKALGSMELAKNEFQKAAELGDEDAKEELKNFEI